MDARGLEGLNMSLDRCRDGSKDEQMNGCEASTPKGAERTGQGRLEAVMSGLLLREVVRKETGKRK